MYSLVAPEKPARVFRTKAANELDAAQLTMSSTIVNTIKTVDNDNSEIIAVAKNKTPLTRQLSVDKATTTKRKHLHFHSPLVKGPMKIATIQQHEQKQKQEQEQGVEQYPYSLFANIMSQNTRKANTIIITTKSTPTTLTGIISTKDVQTMKTSNVAATTTTTPRTINTKAYNQHDHDDNYSNAHHGYEHHGRVSKAMSLKETTAAAAAPPRATGSSNASSRLDRGCTSLMYACQHGDISEVMAQLSNKVSYTYNYKILSIFSITLLPLKQYKC